MKVWNLTNCKLKTNHIGHTGYLNTVTLSPDGSLCASGGKDGKAMLWDLNDGKHLYTLENTDIISSLVFSPNRYKDIALPSLQNVIVGNQNVKNPPHLLLYPRSE